MIAGALRWIFLALLVQLCTGGQAFAAPEAESLCRSLVSTFEASGKGYRENLKASAIPPVLQSGVTDAAGDAKASIARSTNPAEEAKGWLALAIAYRNLGKYADGNAALDRAEALLRDETRPSELSGDVQRERATILVRLGNLEGALAQYRKAEALFRVALGDKAIKVALTLQNESWMLRDLEYYGDALTALNQAGAIYELYPVQHAADLVEVLIETSVIHARLAETRDALAVAERAAALARASPTVGPAHRSTARALHHVGISNRRLMRFAEAMSALAKVHAIYLSQGQEALGRAAEALEDASLTLSTAGCFETAVAFRLKAERLYVARFGPDHDQAADAMQRTAKMMLEMKHFADAEAKLRAVVDVFERSLGPESPRIALVYADLSAVLTERGKHDEAINYGARALRAAQRDGRNPMRQREALLALARSLQGGGNTRGAIVIAKMAVNLQQDVRAQNRGLKPSQALSLSQRYRDVYLYLAELLVSVGRFGEAQNVINLIKEQEVLDFVRGGRPKLLPGEEQAVLTRTERKATEDLAVLLAVPLQTSAELDALKALAKTRPLTDAEKKRMQRLKLKQRDDLANYQRKVKAVLDQLETESDAVQEEVTRLHSDMYGQERRKLEAFGGRAILVQVASLHDSAFIFVVPAKGPPFSRPSPISRADFAKLAFNAWYAVSTRQDDAQEKLKAVYDRMIKPIEADLRASKADVIVFNLEGFLRYVPVAALYSGERYLIQDYAIALQTPAAATVYALPQRGRSAAVGFGVTKKFGDFSELPGVATELETLFDGSDSSGVFAGAPRINAEFVESSLSTALEEAPQIVHIASHFMLTPGDESKSFLLMGDGSHLSLDRLRNDPQFSFGSVDLLTLSACDTAGQVGADGKEVESFATLAQGSGASSVMATLWPIADGPTGVLMADFYRGLIDEGLDKATALRRAQIAMITQAGDQKIAANRSRGVPVRAAEAGIDETNAPPVPAAHPYFWSSFIILGNWL